jgi:DNA-binding NtrC family response regulator
VPKSLDKRKKISVEARKILMHQGWPGNIRELENTLRRAAVWSDGATISVDDVKESLLSMTAARRPADGVLNQSLAQGIDLQSIISEVATHYLRRAMQAAHGNKSKAAELVGLPSYQTLTNWLRKYDVGEDWHDSR